MEYQERNREALPRIVDVGRALGVEVAELVETPHGDDHRISGTIIFDFCMSPKKFPGAIALLIGAVPANFDFYTLFHQFSVAGYAAVAFKTYGDKEIDEAVQKAARSTGISAFRAADDIPWDQLNEFFRAAIVPQSKSGHTLLGIRPGDLFELANAVASLAGGAVAISDAEQTVLAYSTLPEQPIDDTRRASILHLHVPHTERNDQAYRRVHAAHEVICMDPQENSLVRSAIAIRAGDVVLGSLWLIDTPKAATKSTERILLEASNIAALHLLHRRIHHDGERSHTAELVRPLLFVQERAELAALQLGLVTTQVRIAAISNGPSNGNPTETVRSSMLLFDTIRTACAVRLPSAVCGIADNIVYVVLPHSASSSQIFQRTAVLHIVHHARRVLNCSILAGMGNNQPIVGAVQSRIEAESVLAMLLQDFEDSRISEDSDEIVADSQSLGARLQLRQIATALRASGQLPGDLATRISDYDRQRKASYEVTIRTFLDCDSNAIETAEKLGLHSNTVRYRLSRIEALFGINLSSPETRLLVWLQLSMKDL